MRPKNCPTCRMRIVRLDAYDAYACRRCDRWFSKPCPDKRCDYCTALAKLPRPSDAPAAVWDDKWNT